MQTTTSETVGLVRTQDAPFEADVAHKCGIIQRRSIVGRLVQGATASVLALILGKSSTQTAEAAYYCADCRTCVNRGECRFGRRATDYYRCYRISNGRCSNLCSSVYSNC